MKIISTAILALAITSASASAAAACSTTTINNVMASAIQTGSSVLNVSGLLGCAPDQTPMPNSASSTLTWSVVSSTKQQIVVNFAGAGAVSARYQEIPLTPGAGVSAGVSNDTRSQDAAAAAVILMALIAKERLALTALTQAERASVAANESACGPMPDATKECQDGDDNARAACATKLMWHALDVEKCICRALAPPGTVFP